MPPLRKTLPYLLSLVAATGASAASFSLLTDDFENYPIGPVPTNLPSLLALNPPPPGLAGDPAEIIGTNDGVSPRSGSQMLRFLNTYHIAPFTDGTNSDLYYVLDLGYYAASLADGSGSVDLSAWFNTGPSGINNEYFLGVSAFDSTFDLPNDIRLGTASSRLAELTTYGSRLATDGDASTWEQETLSMALPANTRYLALRLGAHQTGNTADFISAYADDVQVTLQLPNGYIENPPEHVPSGGSTAAFLGTGLAGLFLVGRKKRAR